MITITALIIVTDRLSYLKENINSLIKFNSDIFVVSNGYNKEIFNFLDATKKHIQNLILKSYRNRYINAEQEILVLNP